MHYFPTLKGEGVFVFIVHQENIIIVMVAQKNTFSVKDNLSIKISDGESFP